VFFAVSNLFVGPVLILVQPLVPGFGTLVTVTVTSIAAGLGVTAGGPAMAVWGGPARRRMRGMLLAALGLAAGAFVTGPARPGRAGPAGVRVVVSRPTAPCPAWRTGSGCCRNGSP